MKTREKIYWDASALVETIDGPATMSAGDEHITRPHTLAECFSTLTGGRLGVRYAADEAAAALRERAARLAFVEISGADILAALGKARRAGVRGGLVHDYLHAVAAEKHGAARILTLNLADFRLVTRLPLAAP